MRTWATQAAIACLLLCPLGAGAAQFAPSSLFLSKDPALEGDTVLIHAVVQNDGAAKFPGKVVIKEGEEELGSVPVTLSANEVRAVSLSWTPGPGKHTLVAELVNASGTAVQSERETFTVAAKPKPKPQESGGSSAAAAVESSDSIRQKISSVSPAAGSAVAPAFKLVDGGRSSVAEVLDAQIEKVRPKVVGVPLVSAGTSTIETPEQGAWFSSIFYTIYFYILTVLRFIVGSAGIFYPLLALIFFFALWRTFKRFRRA